MNAKRAGFTLIEMVIAISILALMAVLGWRGLDSILHARMALSERAEATRNLQLTFSQLEYDCAQLAPHALLQRFLPVHVTPDNTLILVRTVNEEGQPTRLQVVAYRLKDDVLIRWASLPTRDMQALASALEAAGTGRELALTSSVSLQKEVTQIRWRVWNDKARAWMPSEAIALMSTLPPPLRGMEITLQLRNQTSPYVKSFLLGAA